jgi:hypothetical protein
MWTSRKVSRSGIHCSTTLDYIVSLVPSAANEHTKEKHCLIASPISEITEWVWKKIIIEIFAIKIPTNVSLIPSGPEKYTMELESCLCNKKNSSMVSCYKT